MIHGKITGVMNANAETQEKFSIEKKRMFRYNIDLETLTDTRQATGGCPQVWSIVF